MVTDDIAARLFRGKSALEIAIGSDITPFGGALMRPLHLSAAALALLLGLAMPHRAAAQTATCKDGTTASQSGRGACSHHGGVTSINLTVSCRDGSTATPGRGACSHHGGVRHAQAARTRSATRIRSTKAKGGGATEYNTGSARAESQTHIRGGTVDCRDGTTSSSGQGACSHHGGVETKTNVGATEDNNRSADGSAPDRSVNGESADASALCNDGTYSHAEHRDGACSYHKGVEKWLRDIPAR
jgi:hypothetical protein